MTWQPPACRSTARHQGPSVLLKGPWGGQWGHLEPPPPSRCAHLCSWRQLNLREEGTHLAPLRYNYNLLPMSSSDRLRFVCPLALWHLFTTSRASQTQRLTRTPGSVMDRLWELSGQTADPRSVVYISQRLQRRLLWLEPPRQGAGSPPRPMSTCPWTIRLQPASAAQTATEDALPLRHQLFLTALSFSSGLLCSRPARLICDVSYPVYPPR